MKNFNPSNYLGIAVPLTDHDLSRLVLDPANLRCHEHLDHRLCRQPHPPKSFDSQLQDQKPSCMNTWHFLTESDLDSAGSWRRSPLRQSVKIPGAAVKLRVMASRNRSRYSRGAITVGPSPPPADSRCHRQPVAPQSMQSRE